MIQKVVIGIVATAALVGIGLLAIFMMQPSEVVMDHSQVVDASPDAAFDYVDDFRSWQHWSPLAGSDNQVSFGGADRGEGAVMEWENDDESQAGQMTIVDSRPGESLEIEVELRQPVTSWHTVDFTFEPVDDNGGTRVTWSTRTETSAPMRLFMSDDNIEEMLGADPDHALAELAAVLEE